MQISALSRLSQLRLKNSKVVTDKKFSCHREAARCSMRCVVKKFAKSLKVVQDRVKLYRRVGWCVCKFVTTRCLNKTGPLRII